MKTFYTYLWLREDGSPYYVGKGTEGRAFRKHRVGKCPPVHRVIIQEFESEVDAFEAEKFLIAYYGRENIGEGRLLNLTDGGEGPSGYRCKRSPETCVRLGAWERTPEIRQRMAAGISAYYANDTHLIGRRFSRLLVVAKVGYNKHRDSQWEVLCDCGVKKVVLGTCLKKGATTSCGCLSRERMLAMHADKDARRAIQVKAGKAGAAARWSKRKAV